MDFQLHQIYEPLNLSILEQLTTASDHDHMQSTKVLDIQVLPIPCRMWERLWMSEHMNTVISHELLERY
jgi:hypothetical protein